MSQKPIQIEIIYDTSQRDICNVFIKKDRLNPGLIMSCMMIMFTDPSLNMILEALVEATVERIANDNDVEIMKRSSN